MSNNNHEIDCYNRAHLCGRGGPLALPEPALAGAIFGSAKIVLNVTARDTCALTTDGLVYNFTGLELGKPSVLTARYTVKCSGTAGVKVKMNTLWGGNLLKGKTYTFPDNKDTVDVQFCYAGSATSCWDESNSVFSITSRDLDLRLTYTAKVAEKDTIRNGTLQLSYE